MASDALLRHDRAIAARQRVDHRRADAAGRRAAGDDHRVAAMPDGERLQRRLAAQGTTIAPSLVAQAGRRSLARQSSVRRYPSPGATAASVAIIAAALSVLAGVLWSQSQRRAPPAEYHTVTTEAPRPAGEIIRAVFASTITLSELQAVLDDAHLKIVAGPTEAGVFSLAAASSQPVDWSLQRLRLQPAVRFAEPSVPTSDPAHTR